MNAISRLLPESSTDRRTRQLDCFRRAADKAMRAVDIASEQLETAHASGEPGATASPTLDLARATRALVVAITAENRVVAGQAPLRARADDPRRAILAEPLHKAAKAEPDPKARAALHREIDERVEETLLIDPDADIDIAEHFVTLVNGLDLVIDVTKLSDEVLGMSPRTYPQPGDHPLDDDTDDPLLDR